MVKILTYHEIDIQQWQELIETSATATWFQTPEAYQFYVANKEEMMPFAIGVEEDGHLTGVIVGYTTQERNPIKQLLTCRSIIIGGPLLDEHISNDALSALLEMIGKESTGVADLQPAGRSTAKRSTGLSPIYIETRNFHDYSRWKEVFETCGFLYQPHYDIHVHCNATHTMSEQRIRQVKKAVKNGTEICEAQSEQEIRDWYQILQQLYREKVRTPLFSEEFFLRFYREIRGIYLLVKFQGKVIGGMMCPILNNKAIYEWYVCGLDEEYRELYPSVMATYAAIEYAKAKGLPLFDFMGAGKPTVPYGVRDFKIEFGGKLAEYGRFLCIRKPLLYQIGKLWVRLLKYKY
ncbi:MAG: peptidoglycan bridge formation glycyltransferase FemA/FemB family protein [Paludibacteraceae bacterium]|nr:peptidoglycan bridge formation glycyltransferase FemA/FemB family protein [Paludibacteraceae bacterium]